MNLLIGTILLFTLFLLFLLLAIYLKTKNQGKHLMQRANDIDDFTVGQFIMGQQNSFLLVSDRSSQRLAYLQDSEDYVFPFDSVVSVELFKNAELVAEYLSKRIDTDAQFADTYKKSKAKQLLPKSSSKASTSKPTTIKVRITLVGHHHPCIDIDCFDSKTQLFGGSRTLDLTNHESQLYRRGLQTAQHIVMLITKVIDLVDSAQAQSGKKTISKVTHSGTVPNLIADELEKLLALKNKGALSESEFEEQKKRLLNS